MKKEEFQKYLATDKPTIIVGEPGDGKINQLQELGYTTIFNLAHMQDLTEIRSHLATANNKIVLDEVNKIPLVTIKDFMEMVLEYGDKFLLVINDIDRHFLDEAFMNKCVVILYTPIIK